MRKSKSNKLNKWFFRYALRGKYKEIMWGLRNSNKEHKLEIWGMVLDLVRMAYNRGRNEVIKEMRNKCSTKTSR